MKKTVPFDLFGNKSDYLTLNIKDLMAIEAVSGLSIIDIFRSYSSGAFTLTSVYQILPFAYADCAQTKGDETDVTTLINAALENGVPITKFGVPLAMAIIETGIFGKKQNPKTRKTQKTE